MVILVHLYKRERINSNPTRKIGLKLNFPLEYQHPIVIGTAAEGGLRMLDGELLPQEKQDCRRQKESSNSGGEEEEEKKEPGISTVDTHYGDLANIKH